MSRSCHSGGNVVKFYVQENVTTTCIAGYMDCVMAIAQEYFKTNFDYLNMWGDCSCPLPRCR
jgi:hypothetical protein